jgi:hypothetical protein
MRKFDFALQTLLFGSSIIVLISAFMIEKGYLIWLAVLQFLLGAWQLLSASATVANRKHGNTFRTKNIRIYWLSVMIYFAILGALYVFSSRDAAFIWFPFAWGIAIYYYVITIKLAFGKTQERKTFLDIAN